MFQRFNYFFVKWQILQYFSQTNIKHKTPIYILIFNISKKQKLDEYKKAYD